MYTITTALQLCFRDQPTKRHRDRKARIPTHSQAYTHKGRERQREREESHRPPGRAEQHDLPTDCPPAECCKQSSPSPRIPKSCPPLLLLLLLLIPSSYCSLFLQELLLLQLQLLLLVRLLDVFSPIPKKLQNLSFCLETLQMRCNGYARSALGHFRQRRCEARREEADGRRGARQEGKRNARKRNQTKPNPTQPHPARPGPTRPDPTRTNIGRCSYAGSTVVPRVCRSKQK